MSQTHQARIRLLNRIKTGLLIAGLSLLAQGHAHTAIEKQLVDVNQKIEADADNYELYLRRADIYRLHNDWDLALADLTTAEKLGPPELTQELNFFRGQIWLDAGETQMAQEALTKFLERTPNHYRALVLRARAHRELGEVDAAVLDYSAAIASATDPSPGIYLERAQLLVDEERNEEALRGIEEAVERKGSLVTLIQFAVDTEEQREEYASALDWIARLPTSLQTQSRWLLRSGDIQAKSGNNEAAKTAWQSGLEQLNRLPPGRQATPANTELRKELEARLRG